MFSWMPMFWYSVSIMPSAVDPKDLAFPNVGDQIDGRVVPRALLANLPFGDVGIGLLNLNGDAVLFGRGNPLIHIVGLWCSQLGILARGGQVARFLANDGLQAALFDFVVAFGRNFLCHGEVEAGLCFVRVGNGCRADFKILFGRLKLLGDGGLVGPNGFEVFDGVIDIEIRLGNTQDQILASLREIGFGLGHLDFRLVVTDPVLPAEKRLGQGQLVTVAVETRFAKRGDR